MGLALAVFFAPKPLVLSHHLKLVGVHILLSPVDFHVLLAVVIHLPWGMQLLIRWWALTIHSLLVQLLSLGEFPLVCVPVTSTYVQLLLVDIIHHDHILPMGIRISVTASILLSEVFKIILVHKVILWKLLLNIIIHLELQALCWRILLGLFLAFIVMHICFWKFVIFYL